MTLHLVRANDRGEVLDASGKVVGVIVPVEATESMKTLNTKTLHPKIADAIYTAMIAARPPLDPACVVKMPERNRPIYRDDLKEYNEALDDIAAALKGKMP